MSATSLLIVSVVSRRVNRCGSFSVSLLNSASARMDPGPKRITARLSTADVEKWRRQQAAAAKKPTVH